MSELYNFEYYHNCCGPIPYEQPEHWVEFFGVVADHIVKDLHPRTVLDAGCAMGYLVAALRDRGVEAYGVDISEYAISKVREDVRQYCAVGSLTDPLPEPLPRRYDLVTCIEVLEHIYAEDGRKAIENLCSIADCIIFCSSPDDFTEATHVNVQQREYWARLFANSGFLDDMNYRPKYLTPYAVCYRKSKDWLRQVEDYERNIRQWEDGYARERQTFFKTIEDKDGHIQEQAQELALVTQQKTEAEQQKTEAEQQKNEAERRADEAERRKNEADQRADQVQQQKNEAERQREELASAARDKDRQIQALSEQLGAVNMQYQVISNAACWKMTKPLRVVLDKTKALLKSNRYTHKLCRGLKCLKENGVRYTWRRIRSMRCDHDAALTAVSTDLPASRLCGEPGTVKFSVLVPLYNTNEKFLREMIGSVVGQTYDNWELCLADGSDDAHAYVERICREYAAADPRVKYKKLEQNKGISENTNACAAMAEGDYIALLDHDDLLMANALDVMGSAIAQTEADVLYSDEDHLSAEGKHVNPFFKPDWSPDLLYSQNYICHFLTFRRTLFESVGGFRAAFDGSQDYDLILRLTERTDRICHVPVLLYSWRESETSTAANADSKPYAHCAGKRALDEHLKRKYGAEAYAEETDNLFVYNARFKPFQGLVSIIIPFKDRWKMTDDCVSSILEKTSYADYEILLLDNRSEQAETKKWMEQVQKKDARIRVIEADMEFNWSKLNNFGISHAKGDVFVFLNNDTLVVSGDWIERLCENAVRDDVGAVGGLLLYPDDTIQHAGVVVGIGGWAEHVFKGMRPVHYGAPFVSPVVSRNVLAVTGACMAISRRAIETIGPFDESFIICGSDVEWCIRAYEHGRINRYDAHVTLHHLESKSRDSYIPPVDFERSYAVYGPYRENVDPYFNVNLDTSSTEPRVKLTPMDRVNFKNYFKNHPLTAKAYQALNKALMPQCAYEVPEIQPFRVRMVQSDGSKRLNLVVPSVDQQHVFGGIATALTFFETLRKSCGCQARIVVTDACVSEKTAVRLDGYAFRDSGANAKDPLQVVALNDRVKSLEVHADDIFVVTAWWTAYVTAEVIRKQAEYFHCEPHPVVYMIQDYEPGFYPWSTRYMLAESTYRMQSPVYAVVNSRELSEYFKANHYDFAREWIFDPVLNESLRPFVPAVGETIRKKKQILVYGRPSTARNAFELLIYALKRWRKQQADAEQWQILSAGEQHDDVDLGDGVFLHSVGKLSLEDYARVLLDTYAGVSLMVSPHPSYPPMEMAAFGIRTITNGYANKDLSGFSRNIVSLQTCEPMCIANALQRICDGYTGTGSVSADRTYINGSSAFDTIAGEILGALNEAGENEKLNG